MATKQILDFFMYCSYRKHDENTLSDITYAMCESFPEFKNFFLNFCFEKDYYKDYKSFIIRREVLKASSRPDFFIEKRNKKGTCCLIESKIKEPQKDREYHIEQYNKTFPKIPKTLITVEIPSENIKKKAMESGWNIVLWNKFYYNLKEWNNKNNYNKLIYGYLEYLECVFSIKDISIVNLNKYSTIPDFLFMLKLAVQELNHKSIFCFKCNKYGINISYDKGIISIYTDFVNNFCIDINSNCKILNKNEQEKFNNFRTIEEQKKYIKDLIKELLSTSKSEKLHSIFYTNYSIKNKSKKYFEKLLVDSLHLFNFKGDMNYYGYYVSVNSLDL